MELKEKLDLSGAEISINNLPAGVGVPFVHAHKQNEEIYIILSGSGLVYIDGEEFEVQKGDVLKLEPNAKRCVKAIDDLTFICIQVKQNSLEAYTMGDGIMCEEKPSWS